MDNPKDSDADYGDATESLPDGEPSGTEDPNDELARLRSERNKYLELAKRARADFDNYQKRISRELQTERMYAAQPMIADLLPVLDNLDRALESAKDNAEAAGIVEGVQMVRKQFQDAFEKHGVRRITPNGVPFDPNFHEAVMQIPTADHEPMTIVQTLQSGYTLHERVIRPAQVIVAAPPPSGD